nr:diphthine--ammonia ligase-like [Aedes albopictus]XP_029728134.1 diphthine--ammonia ligase-like [Aedes albopictus]
MRVVALVSGGKGTFNVYNMVQVVAQGHQVVALANLYPKQDDGMYQTVAHQGIEKLAQAMELPLYRKITPGNSRNMKASYDPAKDDEAEDLYELLQYVKEDQNVDGVAVGSIQTDYQLIRVEYVCHRLQLNSLAYLWQRDQAELLQEMIDCQVYAIIIKVAAQGLVPEIHLGKSLKEMQPHLLNMKDKYGSNVCGEGGEYDTLTLDCPLFKNRIVIDDVQMVISSADSVCCAGYLRFSKLRLVPKERVKTVVKSIVSPERETLPKQPGPNFVMPNNQKLVPASNDQITEEAITEDCATEIQLSQSPLKIIAERLSVNRRWWWR